MTVQPSTAPAAPTASVVAWRSFVPPHKLRRRTATSVCAGVFDEIATPRGSVPKYTALSGVANVNWVHATHDEQERPGHVFSHGTYPLATDLAATSRGSHKNGRTSRLRDIYSDLDPYAGFSPLIDEGDDGEYLDELLSDFDDEEFYGPLSALPPTPGRSVASSVTSRTSSRRPHTPFDLETLSPTTTVSPTLPPMSYPAPPLHRRYTMGDSKASSAARKPQGKTRPRADSMNSEPDPPLAKRPKIERGQTSKSGPRAQSNASGDGSTPKPRGRKSASRKGWKGWVEVEDDTPLPPTLIKLDAPAPILPERRTRSGKNFDGIALGDGNWV